MTRQEWLDRALNALRKKALTPADKAAIASALPPVAVK